jgi:ribonucleoside-triphosphate reductase
MDTDNTCTVGKGYVVKRNGKRRKFRPEAVRTAVMKAWAHMKDGCAKSGKEPDREPDQALWDDIYARINALPGRTVKVEDIQDIAEDALMDGGYTRTAKAYILYRESHMHARFIRERIDFMDRYSGGNDNAATSSETDANSNVTIKNVNTEEPEVFKLENRLIQRCRMSDRLNMDWPDTDLDDQYEKDIDGHEIYVHDEASSPAVKFYCQADSLYPLMLNGIGCLDGGKTEAAPDNISSFSGQLVNFIHAASGACKGAVAVGGYFTALNWYVVKEFGDNWYDRLDETYTTAAIMRPRTVWDKIRGAFKQFVYGVNQPAGNRGGQSPFTNISYFDHTYFDAMFGDFCYPDGTKPEWKAVDKLQRLFMRWFNERRLKSVLTFPVETLAMVYDPAMNEIIDRGYRELCAEMYAEGHSFFTYISDSADSLASCCRLRNKMARNTFSPTSGLTGIKTGSCNVITLNMSRILQNALVGTGRFRKGEQACMPYGEFKKEYMDIFTGRLKDVLRRVYRYHISYKRMLYREERRGMFHVSNGGYISMKALYSTVGINGLNEAARYIGLKVGWNPDYVAFLQAILGTVKECNEKASVHDPVEPVLFNSEVVPAEGLGGKNWNWDRGDGYWVPMDENLYNSYFYDAHDSTPVLDKFRLHGRSTYQYTDGGSALHCNLNDHLTKNQYLKLIDFAVKEGTQYFTFNIPNTKCEECGYVTKHPLDVCPKCGSRHVTRYTRVIGYMTPVTSLGDDRREEEKHRTYSDGRSELENNGFGE